MLKVVMNGAIESLSTVPGLPEAMEILHPAIDNPKVSGRAEDMETGEVLVIVENGTVTYIAPETMTEMLDTIFEGDPMLALGLAIEMMGTLMEEVPSEPEKTENESLLEILAKL